MGISKVSSLAVASLAKVNSLAKASINKINSVVKLIDSIALRISISNNINCFDGI